MTEPSWYEFPLSELRTWRNFPTDPTVIIIPGGGGHEQEITATFGINYDAWENHIPDYLCGLVESIMPSGWKVDNRGSRLEFHPSGRHYGGWCEDDVQAIVYIMKQLGLKPEVRYFDRCAACNQTQDKCSVSCPARVAGGWER